jgi:ferredoxin-type protein NapH
MKLRLARARWRPRWWRWTRRVTAATFLGLLIWAGRGELGFYGGSASAATLVDIIPFVDPLAALEAGLASRSVDSAMLIGAGILLAGAALLGPVFCGWVCPLGLLLDINHQLRSIAARLLGLKKPKHELRGPLPAGFRYALLGALLAFVVFVRIPIFQILSPINLFVRAAVFAVDVGIVIVAAIVVAEWIWPRMWCRTLCPLGGLYSLVGRFGVLRVRFNPSEAAKAKCRQCTFACPVGIRVMEDYEYGGHASIATGVCIRCGECVEACPRGAIKLSVLPYRKPAAPADACAGACNSCGACPSCGTEQTDATTAPQ